MDHVQETLLAAKAGSQEAFERLYQDTCDRNYYIALKMAGQEQDAMDILQDAYVKIFQKLDTFRYTGDQSFASWTGKVVSNTALDFLRKKRPIFFSEMQEDDGPDFDLEDEAAERQPEMAFDRKETARIVQELLECLSEEQRICVIFRYVRQMKISEIAAELECSENTVKSRLNYAKRHLLSKRETLEKKGVVLRGIAPFTVFVFLLREDVMAAEAPSEAYAAFAETLNRAFHGPDARAYSGCSKEDGIRSDGDRSGNSPNFSNSPSGGIGDAVSGAQAAAKAGMAKIAVTVAAAVAIAGAAFASKILVDYAYDKMANRNSYHETVAERETERLKTTEETESEEKLEEETEKKTDEEIFYDFLRQEMLPEYGLAELHQEKRIAMDYTKPDSRYSEGNRWFQASGIVSAYIDDLDMDGQKELFVIYWEKEKDEDEYGSYCDMMGVVYEAEEEKAVFQDKMKLSIGDYIWTDNRESEGNFSAMTMEADGRNYLLFYTADVTVAFSDGWNEHSMQMATYQDGTLAMVQEIYMTTPGSDMLSFWYDGVTYGKDGTKNTERLYDGDQNPGTMETIQKTFVDFFQRKGLDVSKVVEDWFRLEDLNDTENAKLICTLNSDSADHMSSSDEQSSVRMIFDGSDFTGLREHVK